jgi:superfamily II DNA or RNA helicase
VKLLFGAIRASKAISLVELLKEQFEHYYNINSDEINTIITEIENIKINDFSSFIEARNDEYGYITLDAKRYLFVCMTKIIHTAIKSEVRSTFKAMVNNRYPLSNRANIIKSGITYGDTSTPKYIQNIFKLISLDDILARAFRQISSLLAVISIATINHNKDIGVLKMRSRNKIRTMGRLLSGKFNTVIYDECSNIKNQTSSRSLAAMQLRAKNYVFMSATPISNDMSEIVSYLMVGYGPRSIKHLIDIEQRMYTKYRKTSGGARKHYAVTIDKKHSEYEIDIYSSLADLTRKGFPVSKITQFVDRNMTIVMRSNKDIVRNESWHFDLKEQKKTVVPTEQHMQLYAAQMEIVYAAAREGKYSDSREALSTLTNLIKISEIPHLISEDFKDILTKKQSTIVNMAQQYLNQGRSIIIFAQFTEMVRILATALSKVTSKTVYMLGDNLNPTQRFELIDNFRKLEDNACIVGTLNNLGKGFNLAKADIIIMSDIPWSPLNYTQGIGRILRPDQTGKPEVIMVMNKYMIDMYKFQTIISKLNMISKYIEKNDEITEQDTQKIDYKAFVLDMLNKSIADGILQSPALDSNVIESRGL